MAKITPPSHHFVPQSLKYKTLYQEINSLLDYLIDKCYEPHVMNMRDKLNPLGEGFDPEEFLQLVDGYTYKDLIFKNVNPRTLAVLLPRIYTLKGTKKGLKLLLNLLGIKADVYIWWEIIRNLERDNAEARDFRSKFGDIRARDIENCSIYLNYVEQLSGPTLLSGDIDEKLRELVNAFLWVCAYVNVINILRELSDEVNTRDTLNHTGAYIDISSRYDSYKWRFNVEDISSSDVIYNGRHKYSEQGLRYSNPGAVSVAPGYHWLENEDNWVSVGSNLTYTEDYSFNGRFTLNSGRNLHEEDIKLRSSVNLRTAIVSPTTIVLLSSRVSVQTRLTVNNYLNAREEPKDGKLLHNSGHHYNEKPTSSKVPKTNDGTLAYDSPISDKLRLSSILNITIEED